MFATYVTVSCPTIRSAASFWAATQCWGQWPARCCCICTCSSRRGTTPGWTGGASAPSRWRGDSSRRLHLHVLRRGPGRDVSFEPPGLETVPFELFQGQEKIPRALHFRAGGTETGQPFRRARRGLLETQGDVRNPGM